MDWSGVESLFHAEKAAAAISTHTLRTPPYRRRGGGEREREGGREGRLQSMTELRRSAANTHTLPAASAAVAVSALGK